MAEGKKVQQWVLPSKGIVFTWKLILCNTNSKSQQHPRDCSATSDTWLCWKFCHVYVPQKVTCFHTQNLLLSEYQKWLPDVGQQLTLYPHADFLILWNSKNLLYGTANFPAEYCSRVDNKPLDIQCWFQPQTTVTAAACQPQTVQIPLCKSFSSNSFLYYDQWTKNQFKGLCEDIL